MSREYLLRLFSVSLSLTSKENAAVLRIGCLLQKAQGTDDANPGTTRYHVDSSLHCQSWMEFLSHPPKPRKVCRVSLRDEISGPWNSLPRNCTYMQDRKMNWDRFAEFDGVFAAPVCRDSIGLESCPSGLSLLDGYGHFLSIVSGDHWSREFEPPYRFHLVSPPQSLHLLRIVG